MISIKRWLKKLSPVALSKNHRYDRLTNRIIKTCLKANSNCVDAGSFEGEIIHSFLKYAPQGDHFAFEPIPALYENLKRKYSHFNNCHLFNCALGNANETTAFNLVVSNPAYSGLRKRKYARKNETIEKTRVELKRLDDIIPAQTKIDFIKVDVEGAEFEVLKGGEQLIKTCRPLIVFEFGIGAADEYGITAEIFFQLFAKWNYHLSLLDGFIAKKKALTAEQFSEQFNKKLNHYFIAHPGSEYSQTKL